MNAMLQITERVFVPAGAIRVAAVRASGPGGQNVNKVSSKVDVRVELGAVVGLSAAQRDRLLALARGKLDADGHLFVTSQATRDQSRNLDDALEKVRALVAAALVLPKKRKATKPSRAVVRRRLDAKRHDSRKKASRRASSDD